MRLRILASEAYVTILRSARRKYLILKSPRLLPLFRRQSPFCALAGERSSCDLRLHVATSLPMTVVLPMSTVLISGWFCSCTSAARSRRL
jgi:hypothetical protein